VKTAALQSDQSGDALWAYFEDRPAELRLLKLRDALAGDPANPFLTYLLGRRLLQLSEPHLGGRYLSEALGGPLPDSLRREALRLRIQALFLSGDCDGVRQTVGAMPDLGQGPRAEAAEWVDRCAFEESQFQHLLKPLTGFH
jgi:hypothetical protein